MEIKTYSLVIDYNKSASSLVDPKVYEFQSNISNFESKDFGLTGRQTMIAHLVSFNSGLPLAVMNNKGVNDGWMRERFQYDEALQEIDRFGLRPGTVHELLTFGNTFPKMHWSGITAMASNGKRYVYNSVKDDDDIKLTVAVIVSSLEHGQSLFVEWLGEVSESHTYLAFPKTGSVPHSMNFLWPDRHGNIYLNS